MRARTAFLAVLGVDATLLVVSARVLPERVPLHYGIAGTPDAWGSRTEAVATMGAAVATTGGVMAAAAWVVARAPLTMINLPARTKQWWTATPERTARLRVRLADDVWVIGSATLLLLGALVALTATTARRSDPSLGLGFAVLLGGYLVAVLGWAAHILTGRYRPPESPSPEVGSR